MCKRKSAQRKRRRFRLRAEREPMEPVESRSPRIRDLELTVDRASQFTAKIVRHLNQLFLPETTRIWRCLAWQDWANLDWAQHLKPLTPLGVCDMIAKCRVTMFCGQGIKDRAIWLFILSAG